MIWIVCAVAVVVLFLLLVAKKKSAQNSDPDYPYKKCPALFTPAEWSGVLDQALGKDFRLFGKVRVADVLAPPDGLNKAEWQTAFNKITRKHFDFVLCSPGDLSVLCAIELNDKSHQKRQ